MARWGTQESDAGQASVEHAAVVALVLVTLSAAAAAAGGFSGVGVVNAVHAGVRRALCVAGGDDCAAFHVRDPCPVSRTEDTHEVGMSFGLWRLGGGRSLAVERRSDGSVAVTAYDDVEGGVGASIGMRFGVGRSSKGDPDLVPAGGGGVGVDVTVGVEARLRGGWGRTWGFPDGPAAEAFLRRVRGTGRGAGRGSALDAGPPPDVERVRIGADATVTGEVSGPVGTAGTGRAFAGLRGEGARDRRTGRITVSLALPAALAGELSGPLGVRLGGGLRVEPAATVIFDRDRRPRELRVVGRLTTREGARRRDVQLRVDLTRPEAGRGLSGVLRGLTGGDLRAARAAAADLGRWAAVEGWVDEREYRTSSTTDGYDAELGLGARIGLRDQDVRSSDRLVAARTRPPGGLWEGRTDCVARQ